MHAAKTSIRHVTTAGRRMSSSNAYISSKAFIDGHWLDCKSTFSVMNPATQQAIGEAGDADEHELKLAIDAASKAFSSWSQTTGRQRSALLRRMFELQMQEQEPLAQLMTAEMGKPIIESRGEVVYGASFFEWFAEQAKRVHGETLTSPWPDKQISYVREPAGPVAIITPWNFPNAMITRKLAAVLATGCTAVIRPAHTSPFSALAIARLAEQAGVPAGVVNVVPSSGERASKLGKILCESEQIAVLTFTGSTAVGKLLLSQSASTVKRLCLELGGNAPFIVFESANIDKAVQGCIASKFRNSGQTCVCANRIFVHASVHDEFVTKLSQAMKKQLRLGNGADEKNNVGPLVSQAALAKVMQHVQDAIQKGARIIEGGDHQGQFFEPTLLVDVKPTMQICSEETFGPVAAIIRFESDDEVLKLANSSRVGLAGYFYSRDIGQINRISRSLQVGMIGINEGIISTAEAPFGGVKESGLGREGSHFGIDEFTQIKYLCSSISP